ncbi:hypothetical protein C8J31_101205 [Rhizobium sp. PP-CC-2G-626]|nr:hypothetical protein C8J31_101205 [Rhizobium sp. PP-CC-2G-626]
MSNPPSEKAEFLDYYLKNRHGQLRKSLAIKRTLTELSEGTQSNSYREYEAEMDSAVKVLFSCLPYQRDDCDITEIMSRFEHKAGEKCPESMWVSHSLDAYLSGKLRSETLEKILVAASVACVSFQVSTMAKTMATMHDLPFRDGRVSPNARTADYIAKCVYVALWTIFGCWILRRMGAETLAMTISTMSLGGIACSVIYSLIRFPGRSRRASNINLAVDAAIRTSSFVLAKCIPPSRVTAREIQRKLVDAEKAGISWWSSTHVLLDRIDRERGVV